VCVAFSCGASLCVCVRVRACVRACVCVCIYMYIAFSCGGSLTYIHIYTHTEMMQEVAPAGLVLTLMFREIAGISICTFVY
jgi:hypothetical protein